MINQNRNPPVSISEKDRNKIIARSLEGHSAKDISEMLSINYKSVWRIIDRYNKTKLISASKKGGDRRSKLNTEQKTEILSWIDDNCLLRLKDIIRMVQEKFSINVSKTTVDRIVKAFHYNLKFAVPIPERRNCETTVESRFKYSKEFRELELDTEDKNFVFLDEVGFSVVTRPKRGRAARGVSPFLSVSAARSRNISVVAAMNKYGMIYFKVHDKAVNGEDFKECLIELKAACSSKGIHNPIFILDNARIHHYRGLNETIASLEMRLLFLPPYSPFLNPIENIFSVWKNMVIRAEAKSERELKELISSKFSCITATHCDSFYRKMLKYIQKAENREIIQQ